MENGEWRRVIVLVSFNHQPDTAWSHLRGGASSEAIAYIRLAWDIGTLIANSCKRAE